MTVQAKQVSAEAFEAFVRLPENSSRQFELVGGEIVEVVSNPYSSKIASRVLTFVGMYLLQHDIGHLTGADGGYIVSGERYIPDVGFIRYSRQPALEYHEGYVPNAPDLAVEVLSPGNTEDEMAIKVANYLAAGTVVWMFKPVDKRVVVFRPGQPAVTLNFNDTLDGGDLLPGFTLRLQDVFRD